MARNAGGVKGARSLRNAVIAIVAQALLNISVVLALLPTKGIPLPFISYGGSSLVPTLAGVGILLNISQYASMSGGFEEEDYEADSGRPKRARRRRPVRQRVPLVARARNG